jgi:hypothetical protein
LPDAVVAALGDDDLARFEHLLDTAQILRELLLRCAAVRECRRPIMRAMRCGASTVASPRPMLNQPRPPATRRGSESSVCVPRPSCRSLACVTAMSPVVDS